jgi:hypothetical protein
MRVKREENKKEKKHPVGGTPSTTTPNANSLLTPAQ